jgi:DNA repair protein RadC
VRQYLEQMMNYPDENRKLGIKAWAEEDRPREKLLNKGRSAVTDAELLAILIRTGTLSETALDVAKNILSLAGNDLNRLARMSVKELTKVKGLGETKAITIMSALELGRRRKDETIQELPKIDSASKVYELMKPHLLDLDVEQFWILFLNRASRVIGKQFLSQGGIAGTVVDPRMIFKAAIENMASSIVLVHNHPSGNLRPSEQDNQITKKLKEGGRLLEIFVADHVIFANNGYYSYADEGQI